MIHLVTGHAGYEHIKAEDDGAFNASIFGNGQYVMESGNMFEGLIIDNNTIRIFDGDLLMYGRHVRINPNTYEDVIIQNGTSGVNRIDLICMTYAKNESDGTERAYIEVVKGTAASSASVPVYTNGNILNGAVVNQMPLYKVEINGVELANITRMFAIIPAYSDHIATANNPHRVTAEQVGLGNVPNLATNDQTPTYTEASSNSALSSGEKLSVAFGKIAKAVNSLIGHLASKGNPHGVTAAQVGLGNVNNTSDASKPVSTAQATAIADAKAAGTSAQTNLNSHTNNKSNPHGVTAYQVGLGNVPNVATNDQTPTYTVASSNTALASGEKLSVAFGKIAKAVNSLISHLANKSNPHGVTAVQIGSVSPYTVIGSATGKTEILFNYDEYFDIVATVKIGSNGNVSIPILKSTGNHNCGYYMSSSDYAGVEVYTTNARGKLSKATYAGSDVTDTSTITFYGRKK